MEDNYKMEIHACHYWKIFKSFSIHKYFIIYLNNLWVRFSQNYQHSTMTVEKKSQPTSNGATHSKPKFFFNFQLLQQYTQCVTTSDTLKRASNRQRPQCLRTVPLSGFLKNRGRSQGSDLGEKRSSRLPSVILCSLSLKKKTWITAKVINTTREPPPVTIPGPMEDAIVPAIRRDGALLCFICFRSWWCAPWCSGTCG